MQESIEGRRKTWDLINIVHQWPFPCCVWILEFSSLVINQQQPYLMRTYTFDQHLGFLRIGKFDVLLWRKEYCNHTLRILKRDFISTLWKVRLCINNKSLFTTTEANYSIKVCRWGIKVCLTGSVLRPRQGDHCLTML